MRAVLTLLSNIVGEMDLPKVRMIDKDANRSICSRLCAGGVYENQRMKNSEISFLFDTVYLSRNSGSLAAWKVSLL